MNWFTSIQRFYPKYWTKEMVADAVVAGKITDVQFEEITGDVYIAVA
jgi:hypothetical protein